MKQTMKKTLALLVLVLLIAGTFSACGGGGNNAPAGILDQLEPHDIILEIEGADPATWDEFLYELRNIRRVLEQRQPLDEWDELFEDHVFEGTDEHMTFNEIALHYAREAILERRAKVQAFHDAGLVLEDGFFDDLLEEHFAQTGTTMDELLELLDNADLSLATFQALNEELEMEHRLLLELQNASPSQAEIDRFVSEHGFLRAKHILVMGDDEETTAFAMELYEELAALEGDEFLTRFVELMDEYGEDPGMIANPEGYTFSPGVMVPEFYDGTHALDYYGLSLPIRSDFGYHIILRLPIDPSLPAMSPGIPSPPPLEQVVTQSAATFVFAERITTLRQAFVVTTTAEFDLIVPNALFHELDARAAEEEDEENE